jgi:hypothetical protein
MRVQRSDDPRETDKTRPDVVVRCGALGTKTFIIDSLVVVEVLSPSTIDIDRGPKLDFHKSLPTIRHIALVPQDQMRVEHYRRAEQGFELDVLSAPRMPCTSKPSSSASIWRASPLASRCKAFATRAPRHPPRKAPAMRSRFGAGVVGC